MEKLENIRIKMILEQPFFGNLLMHLKFEESDDVETLGIDGKNIFYNKEFIENSKDVEIIFLMIHQILHLILFHPIRALKYPKDELFDKACDLVVNSITLDSLSNCDKNRLRDFDIPHMLEYDEASQYTAEQVYEKLRQKKNEMQQQNPKSDITDEDVVKSMDSLSNLFHDSKQNKSLSDSHNKWGNLAKQSVSELHNLQSELMNYIREASENAKMRPGNMPAALTRLIKSFESQKIDWRTALRNFVEAEVTDYSFNPPDRRFSDSNFMLPDFNATEVKATGIFFFIDVSGSMSDEDVAECKAEVKNCIRQYNDKVSGYLGYFDYVVSNLQDFDDEETMASIEALGGGGTSFINIFKYLDEHESEFEVEKKKVIILTDGYADYPNVDDINVDEVLWVINNEDVTPPFGEVIRI